MSNLTNNNSETPVFVSFHIGRGGSFNNAGHLSFHGEEDFQQLIKRCSDSCMIISEDEKGNTLPDDKWQLVDTGSNVILQGRDEIEGNTGRLEWDTIYDTDYVTTTDNLSELETELIWRDYLNEKYMSDDLKDIICTLKGKIRAHEIKRYPTNLTVYDQNSSTNINIDGQVGEFTREEWRDHLDDFCFDKLSIDKILEEMQFCSTNDKEFFGEDN